MLKNYFAVAIRMLWKNKVFTIINVLGLAIGISASLVIYLLVQYHFTFNKFEKDNDRVYRVVTDFIFSGVPYHNAGVHDPMAAAVCKEVTGIEAVIPFRTWEGDAKISVPQNGKEEPVIFKQERNIVFADSNFLSLLDYSWMAGSPKTALLEPYQTVLTATAAEHYFPGLTAAQIIGREMYLNDTIQVTISGVVKDLQQNTDFTFRTFIAYATLENTSLQPENWYSWNSTNGAQQLLVKLSAGTTPVQIEKQLAALHKKQYKPEPGDQGTTRHVLQPLQDIHFNATYGAYDLPLANKPTLYGLLFIAAFLLILGCINFINLATAQALQRAKEIGIRKTIGGTKQQLIIQFLSETFLLTLAATLLSGLLTPLIIKAFSGFIPEALHFSVKEQPAIILFLFVLAVVVTLLSGFYPALVLSGYKPVLVLKNQAFNNSGKTRTAWLRKSLTVSQFTIAQVFIMATILVGRQIHYSLNRDMGFKKDAIVSVQVSHYDTVRHHKNVLMDKLRSIPGIAMVSLCNNPPSSNSTWSGTIQYKDGKKEIATDVQQKYGDSNYINLYHLKLLAGKNIQTTDTVTAVLINKTYAQILGFQQPDEAIGKTLHWNGKQVPVIGVVDNFIQKSLHEPVKPLIIGSWSNEEYTISIALQQQSEAGATWKTTISEIEKAWKQVYSEDDFEYRFFDEYIAQYYSAEQNISRLLSWATGLAVLISCLGLLGLVMYTTTQRTKEIGIRKVVGASVVQIVAMISKDFLKLVVLAFVIAAPIAWLGMHKWLQNFAYHTNISWWIFAVSGCAMLLIALITLGFQTIKAAVANPVRSLRTE